LSDIRLGSSAAGFAGGGGVAAGSQSHATIARNTNSGAITSSALYAFSLKSMRCDASDGRKPRPRPRAGMRRAGIGPRVLWNDMSMVAKARTRVVATVLRAIPIGAFTYFGHCTAQLFPLGHRAAKARHRFEERAE
jgi:hypothetical protein